MEIYSFFERQKTFKLIIILSLATIAIDFLTQHFLLTNKVYYNSFSEQLSMDQINGIIGNKYHALYIIYPIDIVLLFIKCLFIAYIIQAGLFFRGIEIGFDKVLKISIIAEFCFLTPLVLKFIWFYCSNQTYTIDDLKTFFPLSALNFFQASSLPMLWFYPLKTLNIFEVLYWFVLGFFVSNAIKKDFNTSLNIVLSSYLPALVIWVSFIMFLVVTLNPA